ncbi:FAD/FMN-containing dehydrogenase [Streptomyces sp. Amel2xB2]|uniref:FAD-binding oxidoreductase n=1 Tax=Streptomyces sp. Amel2xB2 TaxID=1305829 RepID=UPI000DBFA934|nr:FAD-binding oxidoreductase [Streptomyces sp. Amel2xB2]RAJ58782.1 FAD/FMN-containing dehydrogenase [Streptomyces sp. Amel2xB2]
MVSRRTVLRYGTQASALAGAGLLNGPAVHGAYAADKRRAAHRLPASAWRDLARALSPGAGLYRPGDAPYERLALPDNLRYAAVQPAGIVACATEGDVRAALGWAADHGMPFAPRSGGHNYAGYSTTPGLLISLRRMNDVTPSGRTLVLGGGATNSDVSDARAANLYFPGGRCPGVGVAGLTLGGGLGFNDRQWGMTCDRLLETRLVLADGSLVRASTEENADLFWACRGGAGGNFGINTGFVFDAVDVSALRATVFDLTFPARRGVEVMSAVQEVLAADERGDFDVRIGFRNDGDGSAPILWLLGQRLGPEDGLRRALAPVLRLGPAKTFMQERHFWNAQDYLMERPGAPAAMASKSLVPQRWLEPRSVEDIVEWIGGWQPGRKGDVGYVTLFAMGGASSKPSPHETAYPHRKATFVIDIGSHWAPGTPHDTVDRLLAQLRAMHGTLSRALETSAAYVNFPDPDLRHWQHAYYDGNYRRLVTVKRRYDPTGLFRYGQSIGERTGGRPANH